MNNESKGEKNIDYLKSREGHFSISLTRKRISKGSNPFGGDEKTLSWLPAQPRIDLYLETYRKIIQIVKEKKEYLNIEQINIFFSNTNACTNN